MPATNWDTAQCMAKSKPWAEFSDAQKKQRIATNKKWRERHRQKSTQYQLDYQLNAAKGARKQFRALYGQSISGAGLTLIRFQRLIRPKYKVQMPGKRTYVEILD